ncbi:MAG: vWA domain-containing protein, partial [Bacteroidota bacterium]
MQKKGFTLPLVLGIILFLCLLAPQLVQGQAKATDFAICINGSGSISSTDFTIQKEGIKAALSDPRIFPRDSSIGFTLIQYASGTTIVQVPYTVIDEEADITAISAQIDAINQISGSTNPGDGINTAMSVLNANGSATNRQIICLSTDGTPNSGASPASAIASATSSGLVLDQFGVIAIEDPPFAFEADFRAVYSSLVFGGGNVLVVRNFTEFANVLGASCVAPNAELIGLEAIQTIQSWEDDVFLIEGKPTLVRAHLQTQDNNTALTAIRLIGRRNGSELPGSPLTALNAPFTVPAQTTDPAVVRSRRRNLSQSLNFQLPPSWLSGTVELEVESEGIVCSDAADTDDDCKVSVRFNPSSKPRIKLLRVNWTNSNIGDNQPTIAKMDALANDITAIYPIDGVNYNIGTLTYTVADSVFDTEFSDLLKKVRKQRQLDCIFNPNCEDYYFGAVINVTGGSRGVGYRPGSASTGCVDCSDSPYTFPHEVGHNLNRRHAPFSAATNSDPNWPNENQATLGGNTFPTMGPMTMGEDKKVYGYNTITNAIYDPNP